MQISNQFFNVSPMRNYLGVKKNNNSVSNPVNSDVQFQGLTKKMKKQTYIDGQKDIKEILKDQEGKSCIVGSLPKFMIDKLPKENRKEAIMEIYDTFDKISEELRDFDETNVTSIDEIKKRRYNKTAKRFENVMKKYNIVSSWDDVDIEYLGKGGKGAGYKLVGLRDNTNNDEDEFVIKVFHVVEGKNWHNFKSHGCYAEINSAQYWMHTVGHDTQRGKFFFGDLKSGYMVNKYVDDDVRLPKRKIDPYSYGLKCTDESIEHKHNTCKGYSFDWGGVRVINRFKNGDKIARSVDGKIRDAKKEDRPYLWNKYFGENKRSNSASKNAGLALAIKHLDDKQYYIDTCISLKEPKVNQALAYVLKYLPYEQAVPYFEKLVQTDDVITQVILFNEIPLLAMKRSEENAKDALSAPRSEILPSRIEVYYELAEKYALPDSIEHLASLVHLLPKNRMHSNYKKLVEIDNYALHERLIYKLSNLPKENEFFAITNLAKNLTAPDLKEELRSKAVSLDEVQLAMLNKILEDPNNFEKYKLY